ncbi:MAG: vitamin K epoxide reductase family protein [Candidatus Yanofskybacteria bacterium]|nr:vitamin K epoxide reductase family protein [Candidatus Yanofskybacteria bacterium]
MVVAALIGFADTAYLTWNHYFGSGIQCILLEGCEVVLASPYSEIFSIPLSAMGLAFYVGIFVLINIVDIYQDHLSLKLLLLGSTLGFISSLILLYLQLFVIEALCFYCLTSLGTSTAVFILSVVLYKRRSNQPLTQ